MDYCIGFNFWKFYLIRTSFTLGEPVCLVKVFRLFRLKRIYFGVQSIDTVHRCKPSYLLAGPACLWCLVVSWFFNVDFNFHLNFVGHWSCNGNLEFHFLHKWHNTLYISSMFIVYVVKLLQIFGSNVMHQFYNIYA